MGLSHRFHGPQRKPRHLRKQFLVAACGLGLMLAHTTVAFAQEEEDDDKTFERRIIDKVMKGLGAQSMDNSGIDYRERSPLVIPPKIDLPAPESAARTADAPNWPKDPDVGRRKAAAAAEKKNPQRTTGGNGFPLSQAELDKGRPRNGSTTSTANTDTVTPGGSSNFPMTPSQLGYKGGLFGGLLSPGKEETVPFEGEPARSSLIQPPAGYQTPSPNYNYGLNGSKSSKREPTASELRRQQGGVD